MTDKVIYILVFARRCQDILPAVFFNCPWCMGLRGRSTVPVFDNAPRFASLYSVRCAFFV